MESQSPSRPRIVWIVPHTHWDREWYADAQTFRLKLVDLLDQLLPDLEQDPGYAHFMLDGQMAVVDDYLEVRPGEEERIRRLAANGRLGMGPWYILMDEFLVSGETIVRDMQLGLARASAFGGAMEVGYLPDMFGHVAQMPQILAGFGMAHAVVWRGVPSVVDRSGFWWRSPDGSVVRAEYLPDGYGNGSGTPMDAKDLVARVARYEQQWGQTLVGPLLWMNGTDHEMPQPWLGRIVDEVNASQDDYHLVVGSLADYLAQTPTENLPTWTGELRSGARANLLMGVASNRVDVKQRASRSERWLERLAEPAAALWQTGADWPGALFDQAWRRSILNSAHDSSCACSIDEVCDAVNVRYDEARRIAEGLCERAVAALTRQVAAAGTVIVNTTALPRNAVVEIVLPGHDDHACVQVLERSGGRIEFDPITMASAAEVLRTMLPWERDLTHVAIGERDGMVVVCPMAGPHGGDGDEVFLAEDAVDELVRRAEALPDELADVPLVAPAVSYPPTQRVLAYVDDVPAFGWTTLELPGTTPAAPVSVTDAASVSVTNGLVDLVVDRTDGTFSVDGVAGMGRLVDDGDVGDTYNWCPPASDVRIDEPETVTVVVDETGPLRATIRVDRTYRIPVAANDGTRDHTDDVDYVTRMTLTVLAGRRDVEVTIDVDNRCADHRLRVVLPLPAPTDHSVAECAFATVRRGLKPEGGPSEHPLPTQPMRRFVCAGGLTVVTDGLLEYELVDVDGPAESADARAGSVAVTLLRCTGVISQGPMATRPLPAGPNTPTPGAQMPGRHQLRFAVATGDDTESAYALADAVLVPVQLGYAPGGGTLGASGSSLELHGAQVSSVRRHDGALEVRVFNPSDDQTTVRVPGRRGWLVDLGGRTESTFENGFDLRPWGIATLRLVEA